MAISKSGRTTNQAPHPLIVKKIDKNFLVDRLSKLSGTAFIIVVEKDGVLEVHDRENNPCQGGHLRTYGEAHDDCTRPKDPKPGDLWKHFPDGKPVALFYRIPVQKVSAEQFEAAFSNESPWVSGFGGEKNRELLLVPENAPSMRGYSTTKGMSYMGVYLKSGDFDPTVFVHLLKNGYSNPLLYKTCLDKGMTVTEALTFTCYFTGNERQLSPRMNSYSFDPLNSVRRMIEQNPVNITGGTWGDRYAYNRPDMASPFRGKMSLDESEKKEKEINIGKLYAERKVTSFDDCYSLFKEVASET